MIIHEPEVVRRDGEVFLQARIETARPQANLPAFFWLAYPESYESMLSTRADTFLPPMFQIASVLHEDLEIRGQSSPRLLYGLYEFQRILHHWRPALFHPIDIKPASLHPAPAAGITGQYASAFSGGIDSFYTLQKEWQADRLTHCIFINGCADIPLILRRNFESLVKRFEPLFQELGITLVPVRTNAMHFSAYRIELKHFLETPILSCALGLSPLLSRLYISSDGYDHYGDNLRSTLTSPHLRTEQFETIDSGSAVFRFARTQALADWAPVQQNLRVCLKNKDVDKSLNCSECAKCIRTRMTLHLLGKLDRFPTFRQKFTLRDYLRWGRWMEDYYFTDNVRYVFQKRRTAIPFLLLGLAVGYARLILRKLLPKPVLKWIFQRVSPVHPHQIFVQDLSSASETTEGIP